MKMIAAIVQEEDTDELLNALVEMGFRATKIQTTGGFLRANNNLILIGVEPEKVDEVIEVIRSHCRSRTQWVQPHEAPCLASPLEVHIGGAMVFVWDLERAEKL